jgi:hypothetical protein
MIEQSAHYITTRDFALSSPAISILPCFPIKARQTTGPIVLRQTGQSARETLVLNSYQETEHVYRCVTATQILALFRIAPSKE